MQHTPPVQVTAPHDIEETKRRLEEELDGDVTPNAAPDDDSGGHAPTPPPPPPPKD